MWEKKYLLDSALVSFRFLERVPLVCWDPTDGDFDFYHEFVGKVSAVSPIHVVILCAFVLCKQPLRH